MYCKYCKRNCNSAICTVLTTGPEILILLFNKGEDNEFNVKINFCEQLNLFNYIQFNNTGFNYKLIGVITHKLIAVILFLEIGINILILMLFKSMIFKMELLIILFLLYYFIKKWKINRKKFDELLIYY